MKLGRAAAAALLLGGPAGGAAAQTAPDGNHLRVYLLTMGTGAQIYERFGHNAIWIRDTVAKTDLIYNYGMFEFPSGIMGMAGFVGRFAMGRPRYWLGVDSSIDLELYIYRGAGRNLSAQELNLLPAQKADLARRLATNALPENRYYTYDYFRDNCSTRVRDMLDAVLGGALRAATVDQPSGTTYRFHTLRSITNDKLLWLAIDAGLGPRVDLPIDRWQEMFLPAAVAARVADLHVRDSSGALVPLVQSSFPLLTIDRYHVEAAPPRWVIGFLLIGLAIALLIVLGVRAGASGVFGRVVATVWMLLMGIGGLLLLFLWWCTAHVATYANHNALLLTPFALGVVPSLWCRDARGGWQWRAIQLSAVSVLLGVAIAAVPIVSPQANWPIVVLTVPGTLAALWVAARRERAGAANLDVATGDGTIG
ncbi:MAG: DUF4105 domain-containing protein [Gemmatimonadales bacterium]